MSNQTQLAVNRLAQPRVEALQSEVTVRTRVQKFPAWHTKAALNGKCCEGYVLLCMVRLIYQLKSVLK